jgi:hypothetical protein
LEEICKDNSFLKTNYNKYIDNFQYYYGLYIKKYDSILNKIKQLLSMDLGSISQILEKDDVNSMYRLYIKKINFNQISLSERGQVVSNSFSNTWVLFDRKSKFVYSFANNLFGEVSDVECDNNYINITQISTLDQMERLANILIELDILCEYNIIGSEIKKIVIDRNKEITKHSNELYKLSLQMKELISK